MNKDNWEKYKEDIILAIYDLFLDDIDKIIWEKLSDSTRMRNISNYKLLLQGKGERKFLEELLKNFDIIREAQAGFIEGPILEMKSQIRSAEIYLVPIFEDHEAWKSLKKIFFVKKKDKLDALKQRIKRFLEDLLPDPEPGFHH